MTCLVHTPEAVPVGRAMTRCECAEVSFAEVAQQVRSERLSLDEIAERTGCGGRCTACVPDLQRFLAAVAVR